MELELYRQAGLATTIVDKKPVEFNRSWGFSQMHAFFCSKLPKLFTYFATTYPHVPKTTSESVDDKQTLSKTLWPYLLLVKDRRSYTVCTIDHPTAEDYLDAARSSSGSRALGDRTIHLRMQATYPF
jgi:hypothetical protein